MTHIIWLALVQDGALTPAGEWYAGVGGEW